MPEAAVLIKDAADYIKELNEVAGKADTQSQAVQKAVNANPATVKGIRDAATAAGKPLVGWDKTYAEAEKLLPAVQKIKVPEAQAAAKNLAAAMAKADKALTNLHGQIDMSDKIADKSEKEDNAIGGKLDTAIKEGEKVASELGELIILLPGQFEQVESNLKQAPTKPQFGKLAKTTLTQAKENVKKLGQSVTSAESYSASLKQLAAKGKEAYIPEVKKQGDEAQKLCDQLANKAKEGRKLNSECLTDIKNAEAKLKTLGIT
ncbi:MAG: hypothetical protein ACTHN5_07105 [Phycisphaerae bacterium]